MMMRRFRRGFRHVALNTSLTLKKRAVCSLCAREVFRVFKNAEGREARGRAVSSHIILSALSRTRATRTTTTTTTTTTQRSRTTRRCGRILFILIILKARREEAKKKKSARDCWCNEDKNEGTATRPLLSPRSLIVMVENQTRTGGEKRSSRRRSPSSGAAG